MSSTGLPSLAEGSQDGPEPRPSSQTSSQQERKERQESEEKCDRLYAARTRFTLDYTLGRFTDHYDPLIKPEDYVSRYLIDARSQLEAASQAIEHTYHGLEPRERVYKADGTENQFTRDA